MAVQHARAATRPTIRTPDQRVRVFVSSTLHELAEERACARSAILRLRLTPVMFETGARPHAPRDLYRAYLEQSDVFVAIYGRRYGWVAPGEQVSGLEDEYVRSGGLPRLVYVKRVDGAREAGLEALLERVRNDDRASYRSYGDASELAELLADDLAALLSERFARPDAGWANAPLAPIPAPWGPLIGREAEVARVRELLDDPAVRLVTLVGPGGIGKSRLALEVAATERARRADGVAFVGLQSVLDPGLVAEAIASALGIRATDERDLRASLAAFVSNRDMLLVLDNFEQVLDAAPLLSSLIEAAPRLELLVTSRTRLRLSSERVVPLAPLPLEPAGDEPTAVRALRSPAVALFLWRARAVRPDLELSDENAPVVLDIVRRLEGWPLAVVLAASRAGHLSLHQIRDRLSRRLDLLVGGARDLPHRQQTLRATIDWSLDHLGPDARLLLARCSVFVGGFTLESLERLVEHLPWSSARPESMELLAELIDGSLLSVVDGPAGGRYGMLELLREAAAERLTRSGERPELEAAHARVFVELVEAISPLAGTGRPDWYAIMSIEQANLRVALQGAVARGDLGTASRFASSMWLFWWMRLQAAEHLPWITAVLERPELADADRAALHVAACALSLQLSDVEGGARHLGRAEDLIRAEADPRGRAVVELGRALVAGVARDVVAIRRHALRARELAAACAFGWVESFACVAMGRVGLATGRLEEAVRWSGEGVRLTRSQGDRQSEAWALLVLGLAHTLAGRHAEGLQHMLASLSIFGSLGVGAGQAMVLRSVAFHAGLVDDVERSARLAGAAECAQYHHGALGLEPDRSITTEGLERVRAGVPEEAWRVAFEEGRAMPLDVAVRYAASGALRSA